MADSRSFDGGTVGSMMACLLGESTQLSFDCMTAPFESRNSRTGSGILPETDNEGPIPRMRTFCELGPTTIVPAIRTLSPVETNPRVEMFANLELAVVSKS